LIRSRSRLHLNPNQPLPLETSVFCWAR
jgi:hypothetical protein